MADSSSFDDHLNDPNYDFASVKQQSVYSHYDSESHLTSDRNSTSIDFDDESPYPEVRAAVASVDDPAMPVNTFRMWFLGVFFTLLVAGMNQVFSFRYPSVLITGIVAQLIALPFGKALERILPTTRVRLFNRVWSLNPGPFNIKEHVCITVMANVVVSGAYATDVIATQRIFYNQHVSLSYQLMLVLSTQILGFSLGGLLRQFVVWPSSMIWPGALVNSALFNTLHKNYGKSEHPHMSRERFFCYAVIGSFVWYWFPGYLFTALSVFNWVCWIAPNNVPVNALFGTNSGLGMGIFTFDWAMISYIGSPLVTPWWSEMNTTAALIIFFYIITPILYFTNTFYAKYLPISAYISFDNTGNRYDPSAIVTDGKFDLTKYEQYSPLFVSSTLAMAYALAFASFTSVVVHTFRECYFCYLLFPLILPPSLVPS
jgi:OPT family small oligopeptide transporter